MKKIIFLLLFCISTLGFLLPNTAHIFWKPMTAHAQVIPPQGANPRSGIGQCSDIRCPTTCSVSGLPGQGTEPDPCQQGVYMYGGTIQMLCVGTDSVGQCCSEYRSCPTDQNTQESCGRGAFVQPGDQGYVGYMRKRKEPPTGGLQYVTCTQGSQCTVSNDGGNYSCATTNLICGTPPSGGSACYCQSGCLDGDNLDYRCCHRKWGTCSNNSQTCGTVRDGTSSSESNECSPNGATQSCVGTPCSPNPSSCGSWACSTSLTCSSTNYSQQRSCTDTCGTPYTETNPSCPTGTTCRIPTGTPTPTVTPPVCECGNGVCQSGGQPCFENSTNCPIDCSPPTPVGPRCGNSCTVTSQCTGASDGCTICSGGTCRTPVTPTATATRTPTPSPTPRNGEITGRAYNSATGNAQSGINIYYRQQGSTAAMTHGDVTDTGGRYSFNVTSGTTYEVRAILLTSGAQANWTITVPNSQGRYTNVPPTSVRDFGINTGITPTPTTAPHSIGGVVFIDTNDNGTRDTGEGGLANAQVSVSKPTGSACNGLRNWGPTATGSTGAFNFANLCNGVYTVTIGAIPNGYQVTSSTTLIAVLTTAQPNATINFATGQTRTITGTLRVDNDGPDCGATGSTPYNNTGLTRLLSGATELDSENITNGTFTLTTIRTGNSFHIVLSGLSGFTPNAYRINGGACTQMSGFDFGPFVIPPDTNSIEFFVGSSSAWYQTGSGDMRAPAIVNHVPQAFFASSGNPSSVFFSSSFPADFGQGTPSEGGTNRWTVNNEYSTNSHSSSRRGNVSYSYYDHAVEKQGVDTTQMCQGTCTQNISNLTTGIYRVGGDLTITGYTHAAGSRVTLLVNGNVNINSDIKVPQGLLLVIAKGDIQIGSGVGTSTLSSTTTQLDGIYSAEGNIILDGSGCTSGSPDLKLNIGGVLIANSLQPFSNSGEGALDNRRSLCGGNSTTPSFTVVQRYDFLTQLTDFYKVAAEEWREVAP